MISEFINIYDFIHAYTVLDGCFGTHNRPVCRWLSSNFNEKCYQRADITITFSGIKQRYRKAFLELIQTPLLVNITETIPMNMDAHGYD